MSAIVDVSLLSASQKKEIIKEVEVVPLETKYGKGESILCFDIEGSSIKLPFYYYKDKFCEEYDFPNSDVEYTNTCLDFTGKLNSIQTEIKDECFSILNSNRSVLISLYCGAGKCLDGDTRILMYDGTYKKCREIKIGDILMGDDSKMRYVSSICNGYERMYKIVQQYSKDYIVNSSHIITLSCIFHKKYKYKKNKKSICLYLLDRNNISLKHVFFPIDKNYRDSFY